MNYYLAKCSELNLLLCIQHGVWAQQRKRMSGWRPKDRLILYAEEGVAGLFEVTSDQYEDDVRVWPDKLYPFRVNINSLKVLSPQNRLSLKDHGIDKELVHLYGPSWGMKVVMQLKPIDSMLAKKIENLILAQPVYDPLRTIEEDIKKLAAAKPKSPRKYIKRGKIEALGTKDIGEKSLHDRTIEMLVEIGRYEGKHSESEYPIGNLGRLDVVWKRIKTGNPSYAFEVQDKGNFYQALAKLKHAFDLWNSTPVLVTSEQFVTQAEELLSGSFHEMRRQARVINFEKIRELFSLEERLHKLKDELDL